MMKNSGKRLQRNMRRICLITFQFPPMIQGGAGTAAHRIANSLVRAGHRVHVVAPGPHGVEDSFSTEIAQKDLYIHRTCPSLGNHYGNPVELRRVGQFVTELHGREDFHLLHGIFAIPAGMIAAVVGKDVGVPSVVSIRGSDVETMRYNPTLIGALHWTLSNATYITSVADSLLRRAKSVTTIKNGCVIPNAFEPDLFQERTIDQVLEKSTYRSRSLIKWLKLKKSRNLIIGSAGIMREGKSGADVFLETFARFHSEFSSSHLLIIGDFSSEPGRKEWLGRAKNLHVHKNVTVTGRVPHSQMMAWLRLVDIFVLPSLYEGSPNVLLEAMASERPVIASAVDGVPSIIENEKNGLLVPAGDGESLLACLHKLQSHPEMRSSLGKAASLRVAEHFTTQVERQRWVDLYEVVIGGYEDRVSVQI